MKDRQIVKYEKEIPKGLKEGRNKIKEDEKIVRIIIKKFRKGYKIIEHRR